MKHKFDKIQIALIVCMIAIFGALLYNIIPKSTPVVESKINTPIETKIKASNPIDFSTLKESNEDVYAYIYGQGAGLDYPILQHPSDNAYYLEHMVDHTVAYPASIYTEKENTIDFKDPNTLIYGHNDIISNSMFNGITKYLDQDFFDNNKNLYIYTPEDILVYEVFAAYNYDDRHLLLSYNFNDKTVFQNYINEILNRKEETIQKDIIITNEDTIITLSTCDFNNIGRILVQAVLKQRIACPFGTEVEIDEALLDAKSPSLV